MTQQFASIFNVIKHNVGGVIPSWFMSDDADQFYIAWITTFLGNPKKLLCSRQAWRQQLKRINNPEKEQTYQTLKVLVDETSQNIFNVYNV